MAPDTRLLAVEPVIFERTEMGERLEHLMFHDRVSVHHAGQLIFEDRTFLSGDAATLTQRKSIAVRGGAMASILLVA